MKIGAWIVLIALLPCLAACGQPVRREKLTGGYVLFAADEPETLSLCYEVEHSCIGGVDGTIARVGWDKRYIVAEQHPGNSKAISRFYYIDLRAPDAAMQGVHGPFTAAEFAGQTRAQNLPPLSLAVDETYALKRPFKWDNY
jgi:hypothetical protein